MQRSRNLDAGLIMRRKIDNDLHNDFSQLPSKANNVLDVDLRCILLVVLALMQGLVFLSGRTFLPQVLSVFREARSCQGDERSCLKDT